MNVEAMCGCLGMISFDLNYLISYRIRELEKDVPKAK